MKNYQYKNIHFWSRENAKEKKKKKNKQIIIETIPKSLVVSGAKRLYGIQDPQTSHQKPTMDWYNDRM